MATRFPNGIIARGVPLLGPGGDNLVPFTTGTYFFVDSVNGSSSNSGKESTKALATIQQAINKCTAGKGDVVIVMPLHAETVTATSINFNIAGVTVVGISQGTYRPTLTFSSAAATITFSADSCVLKNVICVANFLNITAAITVGAAKDTIIDRVAFTEAGASLNWLSCIVTGATNNAADGLKVFNCYENAIDTGNLAFISILGNIDRAHFEMNTVIQGATANVGHFLIMSSKVCTGIRILENVLIVTGATNATVGVFMTGSSTTSTGVCAYNLCSSLDDTTPLFCTATLTIGLYQNFYSGAASTSGFVLPAIGS